MGMINVGNKLFECLKNNVKARHFCHLISDAPQEVTNMIMDKQGIKEKIGITEDMLSILLFASPFSINRTLIQSLSSTPKDATKTLMALSKVTQIEPFFSSYYQNFHN